MPEPTAATTVVTCPGRRSTPTAEPTTSPVPRNELASALAGVALGASVTGAAVLGFAFGALQQPPVSPSDAAPPAIVAAIEAPPATVPAPPPAAVPEVAAAASPEPASPTPRVPASTRSPAATAPPLAAPSATAHEDAGLSLLATSPRGALAHFERALELDPSSRTAALGRALAWGALGRTKASQQALCALADGADEVARAARNALGEASCNEIDPSEG